MNFVVTAVEVSTTSVLAWSYTTHFTPLLWALLPVAADIIAGAGSLAFKKKPYSKLGSHDDFD